VARTARAATAVTSAGLNATYTAVDNVNGETMPYNGRRVLHVKNASGGAVTVTVRDPLTADGQAVPDRVVSVPAAGDRFIGLQSGVYLQADGNNYVDYSVGASITAALLEV
jgi:hypothetical protein